MKTKYFSYMLSGLLVALLSLVDDSFAQYYSVDTIVAYSSYTYIRWLMNDISKFYHYSYVIKVKHDRYYYTRTGLLSVALGAVFFLLAPVVVRLYSLTPSQYQLSILFLKIFCTFYGINRLAIFSDSLVLYRGTPRMVRIVPALHVVFTIVGDVIVVFAHLPVHYLVVATGVSDLLYTVLVLLLIGLKDKTLPDLKESYRMSFDCLVDRLCVRAGSMTCSTVVSQLGTELYAIHSICFLCVSSCNITVSNYSTLLLLNLKAAKDKFKEYIQAYKSFTGITVLVLLVQSCLIILMAHGKLSMHTLILPGLLYFALVVTEYIVGATKTLARSYGYSSILRRSALISVVFQVATMLIMSYVLHLGLVAFVSAYLANNFVKHVMIIYFIKKREVTS